MDTIKKYIYLVPVAVFLIIIILQFFGNRSSSNLLKQSNARLQSELSRAIAKQQEAVDKLSELERKLKDAKNSAQAISGYIGNAIQSTNAIGIGLSDSEAITNRNIELIRKLQDGIPKLQESCRVGNITP